MENEKYYYELTNCNEDETVYCACDLPVKDEKLPEVLGIDALGYTARRISKDEYEENADE